MGKTTEIINEVKAHNGIMLCHSIAEKRRIEQLDREMKDKVYTWEEWKELSYGIKGKPIFIDNIDLLLYRLFPNNEIRGGSLTVGE